MINIYDFDFDFSKTFHFTENTQETYSPRLLVIRRISMIGFNVLSQTDTTQIFRINVSPRPIENVRI